jgi:hypothetical protein
MDIEHTLAHGLVCIGFDKKARLILHGGYPIMAYYNPIILDDNPISHRWKEVPFLEKILYSSL